MSKKKTKRKSNHKANRPVDKEIKSHKIELTRKQKKILYFVCLITMIIAFICVWFNIYQTSQKFDMQMNQMILGKDYFKESVVITNKKIESSTSNYNSSSSDNYFFYYKGGQRMQVSGKIYDKYKVGNSIPAYTTNHISYSYYKYGILPKNEFRNNELMKCFGVLLGSGIVILALLGFFSKDEFNFS